MESPARAAQGEDNRVRPPRTSADLIEKGERLLDAIVRDEPNLAQMVFFPKAPFIPLKDVADPARYFDQLYATFRRDIGKLHADNRSWVGAVFHSFELSGTDSWVPPGKEWNKLGYYRTFHAKLRYLQGGRTGTIDVMTMISWQGEWYITHLAPLGH